MKKSGSFLIGLVLFFIIVDYCYYVGYFKQYHDIHLTKKIDDFIAR